MRALWGALLLLSCAESQVTVFTRAPSPERFPIDVRGTPGSSSYDPALGWSPQGLVVAWCETDGTRDRLMLGAVTDGGTEVTGTVLDVPHSSWSVPTLIARPRGWLLAAQSGPGNVALWFVDPEGRAGPGRDLGGAGYEGHFTGVMLDDGLLGAWTSGINGEYDVWGGFIGEGVVPVVDAGSLTPGPVYEYRPSLARVGAEALLAWDKFSPVINDNNDVTWQWLGRDAGGSVPLVQDQHVAAAAGGAEVAVVVWFDSRTRGFAGARVRTSGELMERPVPLGATAGQTSAAAAPTSDGVIVAFTALRGADAGLRLLPVPEAGAFDGTGVWLADGTVGPAREGRPSVAGSWVAFTRYGADGGSQVVIKPFGTKPVGAACRTNQECLTGLCSDRSCAED